MERQCTRTESIRVKLRDGEMGAYAAYPDKTPAGAIVAIMEIRGVNDMLERRLSPKPLVTIDKYPGADHAFAHYGGRTHSKPAADWALVLTIGFFKMHPGSS